MPLIAGPSGYNFLSAGKRETAGQVEGRKRNRTIGPGSRKPRVSRADRTAGMHMPRSESSESGFSTPIASRRRFFQWVTRAAGFIGIGLAVPLVGYVISPALKRTTQSWVEVGRADTLATSEPKQLDYVTMIRDAWLETTSHIGVTHNEAAKIPGGSIRIHEEEMKMKAPVIAALFGALSLLLSAGTLSYVYAQEVKSPTQFTLGILAEHTVSFVLPSAIIVDERGRIGGVTLTVTNHTKKERGFAIDKFRVKEVLKPGETKNHQALSDQFGRYRDRSECVSVL